MLKTTAIALLAAAALAVGAQPAAADVEDPVVTKQTFADGVRVACDAGWQLGEAGAFGAWGHFVDGCTATVQCPTHLRTCEATGGGQISTRRYLGHKLTLNSRLRAFLQGGTEIWHRDSSCQGIDLCLVNDVINVRGGQWVSAQCNGVRESAPEENLANVGCGVQLKFN
jgi:opacity protein-like surface antigen